MVSASFFDSQAPLDLYDSFAKSPVLKHFTFSPTVLSLLNTVMPEIAPQSSLYDIRRVSEGTGDEVYKTGLWKHILALHLRRGDDWEDICDEKGHRSA